MELLLSLTVGVLYSAGLFLMMRRNIAKVIIGLALLSHGANLLIFTAGGWRMSAPPVVPEGLLAPPAPIADPLPQALILTAIVISFGLLAFAITLFLRTYEAVGTDDMDSLRTTDT